MPITFNANEIFEMAEEIIIEELSHITTLLNKLKSL